jgi:hypothetical protein
VCAWTQRHQPELLLQALRRRRQQALQVRHL